MTKSLAEQYGIEEISGVIVTAVEQDSAADETAASSPGM